MRRLYLDLPGHGAARGEASRASADALVAVLGGLCRDVLATGGSDGKSGELEAPLIIGYSYGGYLGDGLCVTRRRARAVLVLPVVEPDFARRPPRRAQRVPRAELHSPTIRASRRRSSR